MLKNDDIEGVYVVWTYMLLFGDQGGAMKAPFGPEVRCC